MAITVSLDRFVDEMDLPSEDWSAFLNRRTGDFVTYKWWRNGPEASDVNTGTTYVLGLDFEYTADS